MRVCPHQAQYVYVLNKSSALLAIDLADAAGCAGDAEALQILPLLLCRHRLASARRRSRQPSAALNHAEPRQFVAAAPAAEIAAANAAETAADATAAAAAAAAAAVAAASVAAAIVLAGLCPTVASAAWSAARPRHRA